ncbi:hypothetical protein B0H19DRAFT_1265783 [Mycena capillaripes]|nr:hypothetical protein B0H19DRAFT_1265783 [Mycena capillaripes]
MSPEDNWCILATLSDSPSYAIAPPHMHIYDKSVSLFPPYSDIVVRVSCASRLFEAPRVSCDKGDKPNVFNPVDVDTLSAVVNPVSSSRPPFLTKLIWYKETVLLDLYSFLRAAPSFGEKAALSALHIVLAEESVVQASVQFHPSMDPFTDPLELFPHCRFLFLSAERTPGS